MDEIQVFDIKSRVVDSVIDIFDTMMSLEVALVDEDQSARQKGDRIAGNISFAGVLGTPYLIIDKSQRI